MNIANYVFGATVAVCATVAVQAAVLSVIDFESHAPTASYGSPAHAPGSLVFKDGDVAFVIDEFTLPGGGKSFNAARIVAGNTGQALELNNVVLRADFGSFASMPHEITLEYRDLGGSENLRVNGGSLHSGDLGGFSSGIAPGVDMFVTRTAISGGYKGKILLRGAVETLEIGGEEFVIDNLRVDGCPK